MTVHFALRAVRGGWVLHRDAEPVGEFATLASALEAIETLRAAAGLCDLQTSLIIEFKAPALFDESHSSDQT